jgi:hypothetical protein
MAEFDVKKFVAERDAALLSMDKEKIIAHMKKYGSPVPDKRFFWLTIHKARTGATGLPMVERAASKWWLIHFGSKSIDDGDVLPPTTKAARRKYDKLCDRFLRPKYLDGGK